MQRVYKDALDEDFLTILTKLIGYLRRQQNLVTAMQSTCPKVADTRWLSMAAVTHWLTTNIIVIQWHLDDKNPPWKPSATWWIFLFVVNTFSKLSKKTFVSLQGLTTLLCEQKTKLEQLVSSYCGVSGMKGPLSPTEMAQDELSPENKEYSDHFLFAHTAAIDMVENLDPWVLQRFLQLGDVQKHLQIRATARMFVDAAEGIHKILPVHDGHNDGYDITLPPVLPHQLVKQDLRKIQSFVSQHHTQLVEHLSEEDIHSIGREFVDLKRLYREDEGIATLIENCSDTSTFEQCWQVVPQFCHLQQFCGGLATTFPLTATVESDFSVLGWEKNSCRTSLTDFSLEGVLYCKQYKQLLALQKTLTLGS